MTLPRSTIRIPHWFQGPTGSGQGGWTTARFIDIIGQPSTVAIRSPIPLDTDLVVEEIKPGQRWNLLDPTTSPATVVMQAQRWEPEFFSTTALSIVDAQAARANFPGDDHTHPVPHCFSCGLEDDSMRVHAGPTGDGRFATDWTPPAWATGVDGSVDGAVLWAALDCAAAWFVGYEGRRRPAFTVQYAVEVAKAIQPGEQYALVAWGGDTNDRWDGRKRAGASVAFDANGLCIARSRSLWVATQ